MMHAMSGILKRPLRSIVAAVLVSGVAVIVGWYAARHEIAGWLVGRSLGDAVSGYRIEEVVFGRLVMTDILLSPSGTIDRAEITWTPAGLLAGRVDRLGLSGVETGWRDFPEAASITAGLPEDIVVEDVRVHVSGPWGNVDARLDASLVNRPDGVAGTGTWHASMPGLLAGGEFSITWQRRDGKILLDIAPDRIEPDFPGSSVGPLTGHVVVEHRGDRDPEVRASLTWRSATVFDVAIGDMTLEATLDSQGLRGTMTIAEEGAPIHGDIVFRQAGKAYRVEGLVASGDSMDIPGPVLVAPTRAGFELDAYVEDLLDPGGWKVSGEGFVETAGVQLGSWFTMEEADAALAFAMEDGALRVWLAESATLAALVPKLPEALRLDIPAGDAWLEARYLDDGWNLAAGLEAASGVPGRTVGELAFEGIVTLDPSGVPVSFSVSRIELVSTGELVAGHALGSVRIAGSFGGTPGAWRGTLGLHSLLEEVEADGLTAYSIALDLPVAVTFDDGGLAITTESSALLHAGEVRAGSVVMAGVVAELPFQIGELERGIEARLTDTGWIDLQAFEHDLIRTLGPASIELEKEQLPLFVLERLGNDLSWDLRLKVSETPVHAALMPDGPAPVGVEGILPDLGIRLESLGTHFLQVTMESNGGNLRLTGPDLALSGIRALMNYNTGLSPLPQLSADIRRLEDLREPQRFGPLSLDVVTSPVWPEGEEARISVTIHSDHARFLGAVDALYTPHTDRLEAYVRTSSVFSESPGMQPADLSPLYGSIFRDTEGILDLNGRVWFEHGEVGADLAFTIDDVSAEVSGIPFEHLEGTATFIDVLPAVTRPGQTFTVARLDTPVPLSDIEVALSLPGDGSVVVERATAKLPSGRPFALESIDASGRETVFRLTGLDAGSLLDHAGVEGIRLKSRLDGEIHTSLEDKGIAIRGAQLRSDSPGTVSWTGGGSLDFDALAFEFDRPDGTSASLRVTIAGHECRIDRIFPLEGDIGRLADEVRAWLDNAGCDRT